MKELCSYLYGGENLVNTSEGWKKDYRKPFAIIFVYIAFLMNRIHGALN